MMAVAVTTPRIGGNRPRRPVRHVRRSCDLSSLTSSAAQSRASCIFPASRKARAFAKAWLSADRSAADSFPDRAPRALREAADVLRIGTVRWSNSISAGTNLDPRCFDRNAIHCHRLGSRSTGIAGLAGGGAGAIGPFPALPGSRAERCRSGRTGRSRNSHRPVCRISSKRRCREPQNVVGYACLTTR
jgi:hypothetical protein